MRFGRSHAFRRLVRDLGRNTGLICLGVFVGGGAFVMLDLLNPPASRALAVAFPSQETYYQTCREAFQDGRTNIRRGEPGYRAALDADRDGLACEPFIRR